MPTAENVLQADYEFTDEPLETDDIAGLNEAISRVRETKERELVRCEERVPDYDVYWNEKTNAVRVAAVVLKVSYEVPEPETQMPE